MSDSENSVESRFVRPDFLFTSLVQFVGLLLGEFSVYDAFGAFSEDVIPLGRCELGAISLKSKENCSATPVGEKFGTRGENRDLSFISDATAG